MPKVWEVSQSKKLSCMGEAGLSQVVVSRPPPDGNKQRGQLKGYWTSSVWDKMYLKDQKRLVFLKNHENVIKDADSKYGWLGKV
ncbi:hypothetical protein LAZ67_8002652 [Cordylochernes scorpioides]|uniref:Uncharacterized protein n=1 Tax=Cordylochernes scorpioides TaxID=51811 RepID=A0ABY6KUA4_9ARAC|nr:hypothetical protein LAZ67_8002652 [Cordylochernes scorpioides]